MIRNFNKNLNPAAKKVSMTIIILLIGVIGVLWYVGNKKDGATKTAVATLEATTTAPDIFNVSAYAAGRTSLEDIISAKLQTATASSSTEIKKTPVITYTISKLIISENSNPAALKYYGQQIAKALKPYGVDLDNEIVTMLTALEQKNPLKTKTLYDAAITNKQIVATLLKITVPKNAIKIHLDLLNNLSQSSSLLIDMSKILDDPQTALISADLYRLQKLDFYKALDNINNFFQTNNIIFSAEEGSKIYMNI